MFVDIRVIVFGGSLVIDAMQIRALEDSISIIWLFVYYFRYTMAVENQW
jgi:hypothetical protein